MASKEVMSITFKTIAILFIIGILISCSSTETKSSDRIIENGTINK